MSKSKNNLEILELISFYKHMDSNLSTKENLFVPISFSPFALIMTNWETTIVKEVILAWVVSTMIYLFYLRMSVRMGGLQDNIFKMVSDLQGGKENSQLNKILTYPKKGKFYKTFTSIRQLRKILFIVLNLLWAIILLVKFLEI